MKKYLTYIKEIYDPEISDYTIEDGLTLDIVFDDIYRDCGDYLKLISEQLLWRGMFRDDEFGEMYPIENRNPRDTPKLINSMFNDILYDKFGWYPRTDGVFAFQKPGSASNYGYSYMIFPVDGFEYIWAPNITDFYIQFDKKK